MSRCRSLVLRHLQTFRTCPVDIPFPPLRSRSRLKASEPPISAPNISRPNPRYPRSVGPPPPVQYAETEELGRRIALLSMIVGAALAAAKIIVGLHAGSTA